MRRCTGIRLRLLTIGLQTRTLGKKREALRHSATPKSVIELRFPFAHPKPCGFPPHPPLYVVEGRKRRILPLWALVVFTKFFLLLPSKNSLTLGKASLKCELCFWVLAPKKNGARCWRAPSPKTLGKGAAFICGFSCVRPSF